MQWNFVITQPNFCQILTKDTSCVAMVIIYFQTPTLLLISWATSVPLNTLRPRRNGCHLTDNIFKYIFFNENVWVPMKISLKFVPKGPINDKSTLIQIMVWHQTGDKPLFEPMMAHFNDDYRHHPAWMSWMELSQIWYIHYQIMEMNHVNFKKYTISWFFHIHSHAIQAYINPMRPDNHSMHK